MTENKQLLQHVFAELAAGNAQPFTDILSEQVQWRITGTTAWSRTFVGKTAVLAELLTPLRARIAGRIQVTADRFIAEGDFVVVEARGRSTTKQGKPYNNSYCWIYRLTNGRVIELTEYMDTALVAEALGDPV
jgi:ketosteroid isomerase-like protein